MASLNAIRRDATYRAELMLATHGLGARDRFNVFDAIEDDGVWLSFEPLERLYGWYQKFGPTAGIAVNSAHPPSLQRFTAAHELGHHVLGHTNRLDDEHTVIDGGAGADPNEVAAQAFAANLLMPLASIEYHLGQLGLDKRRPVLGPTEVYRISVELGVSYSAAAVQLASLGKIDWPVVRQLRKVRPLVIKRELGGREPNHARAAVWILDDDDDSRRLSVDLGDELHVRTPEIRSSGLRWIPDALTQLGFDVLDSSLEAAAVDAPVKYGAPQARHFVFQATGTGVHELRILMRPAWLSDAEPEREYRLIVDVEGPRTGYLGTGLSVNQHPQLLAVA